MIVSVIGPQALKERGVEPDDLRDAIYGTISDSVIESLIAAVVDFTGLANELSDMWSMVQSVRQDSLSKAPERFRNLHATAIAAVFGPTASIGNASTLQQPEGSTPETTHSENLSDEPNT